MARKSFDAHDFVVPLPEEAASLQVSWHMRFAGSVAAEVNEGYRQLLGNQLDYISEPPVDALIGCTYSHVSQTVAGLASFLHVPMVSYISKSDTLSSKQQFPYFLRTSDTSGDFGAQFVQVCEYFGWREVGFLYEDYNAPNSAYDVASISAHEVGINIVGTAFTHYQSAEDIHRADWLSKAKVATGSGLRVFAVGFSSIMVPELLSILLEEGLNSALLVAWEFVNAYTEEALSASTRHSFSGMLGLAPRQENPPFSDAMEAAWRGMRIDELIGLGVPLGFVQEIQKRPDVFDMSPFFMNHAHLVDAITAVLLAFAKLQSSRPGIGGMLGDERGQALLQELYGVRFNGTSGNIAFTPNVNGSGGNRAHSEFEVYEASGGEAVDIGTASASGVLLRQRPSFPDGSGNPRNYDAPIVCRPDAVLQVLSDGSQVCVVCDLVILGRCVHMALFLCAVGVPFALLVLSAYVGVQFAQRQDSMWMVKKEDLEFDTPPKVLGCGGFGYVVKAEYRGTSVAVKRIIPTQEFDPGNSFLLTHIFGTGEQRRPMQQLGEGSLGRSGSPSGSSCAGRGLGFGRRQTSGSPAPAWSLPLRGDDDEDDSGGVERRLGAACAAPSPGRAATAPPALGPRRCGGGRGGGGGGGAGAPAAPRTSQAPAAPCTSQAHAEALEDGEDDLEDPNSDAAEVEDFFDAVSRGLFLSSSSSSGSDSSGSSASASEGRDADAGITGQKPDAVYLGIDFRNRSRTRSRSLANRGTATSAGGSPWYLGISRTARSAAGAWRRAPCSSNSTRQSRLRRMFIQEMRRLARLRHPCVVTVMGAVVANRKEPMLVMEYMEHGSLRDLLQNDTVPLEEVAVPMLQDVAQGVRFLHNNKPMIVHCDLKSSNVLVDARFRAKISDFGLSQTRRAASRTAQPSGTPLWMAPELLRGSPNTPESDVYAFGIVMCEVASRREPYYGEDPSLVLGLVQQEQGPEKRPAIPRGVCEDLATLMRDCWRSNPNLRPTLPEVHRRLKAAEDLQIGRGEKRLDRWHRTNSLLYEVFPKHVADALRDGRKVEPEHREVVTIFFSDIVGFTDISGTLAPHKVSAMLDRLYSRFDALSDQMGVFKVETIGDAYMAVANLVEDQAADHARRIALFAVRAIEAASQTFVDVDDPHRGCVNIRVGFHSGPVVANVVGKRNPRYCLFGDTVNTASRMESNSERNRIHCSGQAAKYLREQAPELRLESRGVIPIKGKGEMETFWVSASLPRGGGAVAGRAAPAPPLSLTTTL